jgi:xanthine dehydrogenase accessory factor
MSLTLTDLHGALELDGPWIRVTIVLTRGSTPRELGASMIVTPERILGTIGGGALEYRAMEAAKDLLSKPSGYDESHFALGARLGQCCGGQATLWFEHRDTWQKLFGDPNFSVAEPWIALGRAGQPDRMLVSADQSVGTFGSELDRAAHARARFALDAQTRVAFWQDQAEDSLFFEPLAPDDFEVWLFGAGHVALACARVLSALPCRLTVVDSRPELLEDIAVTGAQTLFSRAPEQEVIAAPANCQFVVMTHSHDLDARVCEQIMRRGDYSYLGLIGSGAKRASFEKRFRKRGLDDAQIESLVCPLGVAVPDGGQPKEPGVIALGLACQLLERRSA